MSRVLVTYATRMGSTKSVAEAIGDVLREQHIQTDVRSIHDVYDLAEYDAFVVGSAIQASKWLPEAMSFMEAYQTTLARKPFAAFLVCITLATKNPKHHAHVSEWMQPIRSMAQPVSEGLFAGVLDIRKIPNFWDRLMYRLSVWLGVWEEGDHRDWDAIRQWASQLPEHLQLQG